MDEVGLEGVLPCSLNVVLLVFLSYLISLHHFVLVFFGFVWGRGWGLASGGGAEVG